MKLHLDTSRMLELWKLHRGFVPLQPCATVLREDNDDIDNVMLAEIDRWYGMLLESAPESMLAPEDLAGEVDMVTHDGGWSSVVLPEDVVRVLRVELPGWTARAVVVTDPDSPLAAMQLHPFTRSGCADPVAVVDGNILRLYPAAASGDSPVRLVCVRRREGLYEFDRAALAAV